MQEVNDTFLAWQMRNADAKADRQPHPWDRRRDLMLSSIPYLDSTLARLRLTPAKLERIVREADAGDPREQAQLFDAMLEKEPRFAAHLQTRRLAVLSCPWKVESSKSPELAGEVTEMLRRADLRGALSGLMRAVGHGYAGVAVDWAPGGAMVRGFRPVASDRWTFDEAGYPAIMDDTALGHPLSSYHPAQVLYVRADGAAGLPCQCGLLRSLLWLYLFKNAGFRDWAVFLERFGIPFILGKIPSGDFKDPKLRDELLRSIMNVRNGGGGVGTTETDMQMLNGASSGNQQAFEAFQRYCDETATLLILGQLASSDHAGGLSAGTAQDEVRQDLLQADCALLEPQVQKLVDWYCILRHGMPDAGDLRFVIDCQKPEDMTARAQRDAQVAQAAGMRLSKQYAEETYGVRLEEAPQPPPAPDGLSGMGFSDRDRPATLPAAERRVQSIARRALERVIEPEALAAWAGPVEEAVRKHFGDIDPDGMDDRQLLAAFAERAPAFLQSLPGVMDAMDDRTLVRALGEAMLAGYLDGLMPASFWRKRPNIRG